MHIHLPLTCPCQFPSWRARQTAASSARRWCRLWVWAAPGSSASGCCKPGPSHLASCSCLGPRRWTLCPGWRWAARGDSAGPAACWSEQWHAGKSGGRRHGRNPWRWERRSCEWHTRPGRSLHRDLLLRGDLNWLPGRRSGSASWEAGEWKRRMKIRGMK